MDFGIWKNMTTSTKLYKADNFASNIKIGEKHPGSRADVLFLM